jgi:hypothetical protein
MAGSAAATVLSAWHASGPAVHGLRHTTMVYTNLAGLVTRVWPTLAMSSSMRRTARKCRPCSTSTTVPAAAFSPSPTTDALDFHQSLTHSHSGGSVVAASADEIRAWDPKHDLSGASQCRLTTVATVGIRVMEVACTLPATAIQVTEEVACCPSSPLSHLSGMYRVQGGHMHMRQAPGDDDLAHPLSGEHIEIPDEAAWGTWVINRFLNK